MDLHGSRFIGKDGGEILRIGLPKLPTVFIKPLTSIRLVGVGGDRIFFEAQPHCPEVIADRLPTHHKPKSPLKMVLVFPKIGVRMGLPVKNAMISPQALASTLTGWAALWPAE